jgi:hypothetical protein
VIPEPAVNEIARPYRGLSVQDVAFDLTESAVRDALIGKEAYRRTEYLALRNGDAAALVCITKASAEPLFSPITDLRMVAAPAEVVSVHSPETNVANASALARVAAAHRSPGATVYLVTGQYEHVNFIWRPAPIQIRVLEVTPPQPPKLLSMAQQCVDFDEDLPPIELVPDIVDLNELVRRSKAERPLLPCRGSGMSEMGYADFLDTRPPYQDGWTLIGCERSRAFYEHFYDREPRQVDICPRRRELPQQTLVLAKCCLRESGVERAGNRAEVAWGASIEDVRRALHCLVDPVASERETADVS